MIRFLVLFLLAGLLQSRAATYYVSTSGSSATDGSSPATAWSLTKLNETTLLPGSVVRLRRGDVFKSPLNIQNGTPASPIVYGTYGMGERPLISGLVTLTSWSMLTSTIYYADLSAYNQAELNVVLVNGKLRGMGRYPKTGYLTYTGSSGVGHISGPSIDAIPFDPTGAEAVVRKIRQVTDRHVITYRTGQNMGLSGNSFYHTNGGNSQTYTPTPGFGYFIQASLACCTQPGDWYYDTSTKRLYMYFTGSPSSATVRVATQTNLTTGSSLAANQLLGLAFEGANFAALPTYTFTNSRLSDCAFSYCKNALNMEGTTSYDTIANCSFRSLSNNAIWGIQAAQHLLIDGDMLHNVGAIAGMSASGDAQAMAIWLEGGAVGANTVRNCVIDSVGYHGVVLYGPNTLVENNDIGYFGLVKDDAGGVYEYQFSGVTDINKIIRGNHIHHARGPVGGVYSFALHAETCGIYLDADVNHVEVYNNVLENGDWTGFQLINLKSNAGISIHNNTVSGFDQAQLLCYNTLSNDQPPQPYYLRGLSLHDNVLTASGSAYCVYIHNYFSDPLRHFGSWDNNTYNRTGSDQTIYFREEYSGGVDRQLSLRLFQGLTGLDQHSVSNLALLRSPGGLRFKQGGQYLRSSR